MTPEAFYDRLAPFYHLVYEDWEGSVERQAEQLDGVIRELWGGRVCTVLDAACGIGTQAIGLARRGYRMAASDVSADSLERAGREAAKRGLEIPFRRADLRSLSAGHPGPFDLVIACDNAIPHLLSDGEILAAFREMHRLAAPGGGALISLRDYDPAESSGARVLPYGLRREGDRRWLVFQVWEFHGPVYDLSMYFIEDRGGSEVGCVAQVLRTRYYAIAVPRLLELMAEAGFHSVRRLDGRFFQPLVAGFKAE